MIRRGRIKKNITLTKEQQEHSGKEKVNRLHLMAAPLLAGEVSNSETEWLKKSAEVVINQPYMLTDRWINSLNKWVENKLKAMSLNDPEYENGKRYS